MIYRYDTYIPFEYRKRREHSKSFEHQKPLSQPFSFFQQKKKEKKRKRKCYERIRKIVLGRLDQLLLLLLLLRGSGFRRAMSSKLKRYRLLRFTNRNFQVWNTKHREGNNSFFLNYLVYMYIYAYIYICSSLSSIFCFIKCEHKLCTEKNIISNKSSIYFYINISVNHRLYFSINLFV